MYHSQTTKRTMDQIIVFTLLNDFHFDSILQDRIPFTGGVAKSKIFSNYIHRYVQQDLAMQFEAI